MKIKITTYYFHSFSYYLSVCPPITAKFVSFQTARSELQLFMARRNDASIYIHSNLPVQYEKTCSSETKKKRQQFKLEAIYFDLTHFACEKGRVGIMSGLLQ